MHEKKISGLFLIFKPSSARIELRTWRCKADVLVRERARTFPLQEFVSSVSFHIILETVRNPGERAHCVKITKKVSFYNNGERSEQHSSIPGTCLVVKSITQPLALSNFE